MEVEGFLGLVNYQRIFLKNYAHTVAPLYGLTGEHAFRWEPEHQQAFDEVKDPTSALVFTSPNSRDWFFLDTYASVIAIGAELLQLQDGQ